MSGTLLQVALGGAVGATGRYLTGVAAARAFGHGFPWGTLIVNGAGSVLIGALMVALGQMSGQRFAPFLITGVLGGFTTFSAFSLDALTLWERGQAGAATAYVAGTLVLTLGGIALGAALVRMALA